MKKVAICIPSGDMMHTDAAMSLASLAYHCTELRRGDEVLEPIPLVIANVKGSLVVNNRNLLVDRSIENGIDYLFFVDSDIVMHPMTLRQLLSHDKDIVGGTYVMREPPNRILGKLTDGTLIHDALVGGQSVDTSGVMEVGAIPGGCMLIKASVFAAMQKPFFQTPAYEDRGVRVIEGEDYFFCRMARAAGFSVWLDWGVSVNLSHVGQKHNVIPTAKGASDAHV